MRTILDIGNIVFGILGAAGLVMATFALAQDTKDAAVLSRLPWLEWWHVALYAFMLGAVWWIVSQQIRLARIEALGRFKVGYAMPPPGERQFGVTITNKSRGQISLTARATASLASPIFGLGAWETKDFRLIWEETGTTEVSLHPEDHATVGLVSRDEGIEGIAAPRHWFILHGQFIGGSTEERFALLRPGDTEQEIRLDIKLYPDTPARQRNFVVNVKGVTDESRTMSCDILESRSRLRRAIESRGKSLIWKVPRLKKANESIPE